MNKISMILVLMGGFIFTSVCSAKEYTYKGKWVTTNRRLDGIQTAVVTWMGNNTWKARIFGVWMRQKYEYNITFTGTIDKLKGTAIIDRANYTWTGTITRKKFKVQFTGDRYTGSFDLDRIDKEAKK